MQCEDLGFTFTKTNQLKKKKNLKKQKQNPLSWKGSDKLLPLGVLQYTELIFIELFSELGTVSLLAIYFKGDHMLEHTNKHKSNSTGRT